MNLTELIRESVRIDDILAIAPLIALVITSLIPLTIKVFRGQKELNTLSTLIISAFGLGVAGVLCLLVDKFVEQRTAGTGSVFFAKSLAIDGVATWGSVLIIVLTLVSLCFSRESLAVAKKQFSEFTFLLINSALGMIVLLWSNDLIVTFVGIEVMSLCLYMIIGISREQILSKEAAFKYFVLGSFASAILLYGVSFVYGTVGSTYLHDITEVADALISSNSLFLIGMAMVLVGLLFKVAVAPFHAWSPDVYEGAPTPVVGFMSAGVKIATFIFMLRFVSTQFLMGERSEFFVNCLQWLAVITILWGNLGALVQTKVKRLLAYSSIAHSGYALIGVIVAGLGHANHWGASGVVFYLFSYSVMTMGAFGAVCLFEQKIESSLEISDFKGLAARSPWLALCMSLFMLSLAGMPPLLGFFGKFFIFAGAIKQGLYWLAVWGVVGSVISAFYYLRLVVAMYMTQEEDVKNEVCLKSKQLTHLTVGLAAVLVVIFGLMSNVFYESIRGSVKELFY